MTINVMIKNLQVFAVDTKKVLKFVGGDASTIKGRQVEVIVLGSQ